MIALKTYYKQLNSSERLHSGETERPILFMRMSYLCLWLLCIE